MITLMGESLDLLFCIPSFSHKRLRLELRLDRELEGFLILNSHPSSVTHLAVQPMLNSPALREWFSSIALTARELTD